MCNYSCAASSARLRSYESPWGGHRDTAPWLPGLPPARLPPKYPGRAAGRVSRVAFAGSFRAGRAGPARLRTHPRRQPGSDLFSSSLLVAFISLLPVLFNFFFLRFSASLRCHGAVTAPDTHFWGRKSPKRQPSVASVPFHRAICHPAALWGGTKIFLQRWKRKGGSRQGMLLKPVV